MNPFRDLSSGALQAIGGAIALAILGSLAYYTKPVREGLAGWWTTSVSLEKGTVTILLLLGLGIVFAAYMIGRTAYRRLLKRVAFEELSLFERFEIMDLRAEQPGRLRKNKEDLEKRTIKIEPLNLR
jgi:hypothetical protein